MSNSVEELVEEIQAETRRLQRKAWWSEFRLGFFFAAGLALALWGSILLLERSLLHMLENM